MKALIKLPLCCGFLFSCLWACSPRQPQDEGPGGSSTPYSQESPEDSALPAGSDSPVSPAVNAKDAAGNTQLHREVTQKNIENVKILLAQGADVNIQNNLGQTPLHLSIIAGEMALAQLLVETGKADVNAYGGQAGSPLVLAEALGQQNIAQYLKSKGAS